MKVVFRGQIATGTSSQHTPATNGWKFHAGLTDNFDSAKRNIVKIER